MGTLARVGVTFSPLGPNAEGGPSSAPANGGSERVNSTSPEVDNSHLHFNPYPNVAGPGQPKVCEAGNEKFIPFQTVIGNVPGATGTTHDETKRSQNLNGLAYPSSTLRDLGLQSSSKSSSKGSSSKSPSKGSAKHGSTKGKKQ